MNQEPSISEIIEAARVASTTPVPLAPYWEGRNFSEILSIPLHHPYAPDEWNWIFETFTGLLGHPDFRIREGAVDRIVTAIEKEREQGDRQSDFIPVPTEQRLAPILGAIAQQEQKTPGLLEEFCNRTHFAKFLINEEPLRNFILAWLNELESNQQTSSLNPDTILAAKIYFKFYGTSWTEAQTSLMTALDHPDLLVRACAANQIGKFYWRESWEEWGRSWEVNPEMPPIDFMMQFIRDKEIERPGIAGAFWMGVGRIFEQLQEHYGTNIDIREWILDILCFSSSPEPFIRLFACNIGFDAHERFSRDLEAIQRLMQNGRFGAAIAAATEENYKIEALEPLLMELGYSDDPWIIKSASWHLAYHYHRLHPKGEELGYVELVAELPEIDLFLIFSDPEKKESPYAAIIYPKGTKVSYMPTSELPILESEVQKSANLSDKAAWKWVNRIFPESVRGEERPDIPGQSWGKDKVQYWYRRGYVQFYGSVKELRWDNAIVGYRSDKFWNPKQFLQLE